MKKILILMALMLSIGVKAQEMQIECDSVIQVPGKTAQEIYPLVKVWVAENFKSANSVIQLDAPENGVLICKGSFSYKAPGGSTYRVLDGHVDFTLKIQLKDGRCKITVSDFTHHSDDLRWRDTWSLGLITDREKYKMKGMQDNRWLKTWPNLQSECKVQGYSIIMRIKDATSKPASAEDNW